MKENIEIPLKKLNYTFVKKPLLVGGKAMEYYTLRKAGDDIDLIVSEEDILHLLKLYPKQVKDLWGDIGVCAHDFEIWRTICFFNYEELSKDAVDDGDVLVISLEKLLLMKALGMKEPKFLKDTQLIVDAILNHQYKEYDIKRKKIDTLTQGIDISYIEKTGPNI